MQAQKGSSDIMKIMITETTSERLGADVDDGFATTESELAVCSGEAAEREMLDGACGWHPPGLWCVQVAPPESKRLDQNSPKAVAKPIGEAQHHGITHPNSRSLRVKAAGTPPPQQQSSVQDSAGPHE